MSDYDFEVGDLIIYTGAKYPFDNGLRLVIQKNATGIARIFRSCASDIVLSEPSEHYTLVCRLNK